jgi:hypothetical protein
MELNWTEQEEQTFADLMKAGRLERLPAIRLYRRCNDNLGRALAIATAEAPTGRQVARRMALADANRARARKDPSQLPTIAGSAY